jgi:hypothetical protein
MIMTTSDSNLGVARTQAALDAILPQHTHRGVTLPWIRFWTTSAGSFNIRTETTRDVGLPATIRFVEESRGWDLRVPCTNNGLDTIILAMILADALDIAALRKLRDDNRNNLNPGGLSALNLGLTAKALTQ